jgi:2-C-methyl-D-erythritol 4-phosphate cytidylyltransferase
MKKSIKITIIIAAGGSGTRFGGDVPKQFAMEGGRPLLWYALNAFAQSCPGATLIVSMHPESIGLWNHMIRKYPDTPAHKIAAGGKTRFHSVKNALAHCSGEGIILVHDAVRPYVPAGVIKAVIKTTTEKGTAIPVLPVNDSLRQITRSGSKCVNRRDYVMVQTPQGFQAEILKKAFARRYRLSFTDDASVVENAGFRIFHVPGSAENIKVTFKEDLKPDVNSKTRK